MSYTCILTLNYINTDLISYIIVKHWQVALLQINCISKSWQSLIKYPLRLISVGLQIAAFECFIFLKLIAFYENPIAFYRIHKRQPLANTTLVCNVKYDLGFENFIGNIINTNCLVFQLTGRRCCRYYVMLRLLGE